MNTVFLDVDGVLHRGNAYVSAGRVISSAPGKIELFEYADALQTALQGAADVSIVWSTDWAWRLGTDYTTEALPNQWLRDRIVGATFDGTCIDHRVWPVFTRGAQVLDYVRRNRLTRWLAIDDRIDGFEACRDRLVHCQEHVGLGDNAVLELLARKCAKFFE